MSDNEAFIPYEKLAEEIFTFGVYAESDKEIDEIAEDLSSDQQIIAILSKIAQDIGVLKNCFLAVNQESIYKHNVRSSAIYQKAIVYVRGMLMNLEKKFGPCDDLLKIRIENAYREDVEFNSMLDSIHFGEQKPYSIPVSILNLHANEYIIDDLMKWTGCKTWEELEEALDCNNENYIEEHQEILPAGDNLLKENGAAAMRKCFRMALSNEEYKIYKRTYGLTANALWKSGIYSVEKLCELSERDVLRIRHIGRQSLNLIRLVLGKYGMKLKGDDE